MTSTLLPIMVIMNRHCLADVTLPGWSNLGQVIHAVIFYQRHVGFVLIDSVVDSSSSSDVYINYKENETSGEEQKGKLDMSFN